MSNKRKIIICILLVVLIIFLLVFLKKVNNERWVQQAEEVDDGLKFEQIELQNNYSGKIQKVSSIGDLNIIKNCTQTYFSFVADYYKTNNNEFGNDLLKLLYSEYVKNNGITVDNIKNYIQENDYGTVEIYSAFYVTNFEDINIYLVDGKIRNISNDSSKDFEITIYVDNNNMCYQVNPNNILNEKYSNLMEGETFNIEVPVMIKNSKINKFGNTKFDYEELAQYVFKNIRLCLLYDSDFANTLLIDNPYAGDLNSFISQNREDILMMSYGTYEFKYNNSNLVYYIYDDKAKFEIIVYFDSMSSYKFDIKKF